MDRFFSLRVLVSGVLTGGWRIGLRSNATGSPRHPPRRTAARHTDGRPLSSVRLWKARHDLHTSSPTATHTTQVPPSALALQKKGGWLRARQAVARPRCTTRRRAARPSTAFRGPVGPPLAPPARQAGLERWPGFQRPPAPPPPTGWPAPHPRPVCGPRASAPAGWGAGCAARKGCTKVAPRALAYPRVGWWVCSRGHWWGCRLATCSLHPRAVS